MTRNNLASIPTGGGPSPIAAEQINLLIDVLTTMAARPSAAELEITAFAPDQAARLLGKTPNWVIEAIRDDRIPHTYVGRSPRLTAAHIRWILADGERVPNQYSRAAA